MAEAYTTAQQDLRTFGAQQSRLIDDLNRPDLTNIATQYLQDAIRYFGRMAFFFNETDNSTVPSWAASTIYPQGSTIQATISGTVYTIVALNTGTSGAGGAPAFPTTLFTVPSTGLPPPASGTAGTVDDNGGPSTGIRWATVATYTAGLWTQLSTVYRINQYTPPIDYVSPTLVEETWSGNLRQPLQKVSYAELRAYDVIRPSPPYSFSTMWAWFQQQIYLWPYPNSFYPLTLSYKTAPQMVSLAGDSNFWTTIAERLVRKYAQASIHREIEHDEEAAQQATIQWKEELAMLRSQQIGMHSTGGIPPSAW